MTKKCSKCEVEKELEEFHKKKNAKDGRMGQCRECRKVCSRNYYKENKDILKEKRSKNYKENREKFYEKHKEYREKNKEILKEKRSKNYKENKEVIKERNKKYREENIEKERERNKKYREENKEILKEKSKEYYIKNKEIIDEKNRKYYIENKINIIKVRSKYDKERMKIDECFRIKKRLRRRILHALKGNNKSESTMELIGCTVEFLRDYLEGTKVEGKDYSDAHIDHIRPCASFDLTDPEQQRECFHYTNLQYLPAKDNISKGAKILT